MTDATFTFRVEDALKNDFSKAAKAHDQTGAQVMRAFMREYVARMKEEEAHDAWFRQQVQVGLDAADAGDLIPNDEVEEEFAARRADTLAKLGGKGT